LPESLHQRSGDETLRGAIKGFKVTSVAIAEGDPAEERHEAPVARRHASGRRTPVYNAER
jgi:hypothetical protein